MTAIRQPLPRPGTPTSPLPEPPYRRSKPGSGLCRDHRRGAARKSAHARCSSTAWRTTRLCLPPSRRRRASWALPGAPIASHQRAGLRPAGQKAMRPGWKRISRARSARSSAASRRDWARPARFAFDVLKPAEAVAPWIDQFLALEQTGWKGRRGTAIAGDERLQRALRSGLERLAAYGDLGFWRLAIDGRPAAMLFAAISGDRAWLVKIAHDEALARFSPGTLIILEASARDDEFRDVSARSIPVPFPGIR